MILNNGSSVVELQNLIWKYGYPKFELWSSIIESVKLIFYELHNSAKIMEIHDLLTELDSSIVQFCNWFLEIRNLWKSIAVFS